MLRQWEEIAKRKGDDHDILTVLASFQLLPLSHAGHLVWSWNL